MTFTRTASGLANQSLFFGKRFIVYVEEDGNLDPGRSVDIAFWRLFFRSKFPNNNFEIRGLGGKVHVIAMAEKVIHNSVPNVLCAMDADYDEIFDEMIKDERVFYTFGYGVENDIINELTVKSVVKNLVPGTSLAESVAALAWNHIETSMRLDRICYLSDQIASARAYSTLDRRNPTSNLIIDILPIRIRRENVLQRLKKSKALPPTRVKKAEKEWKCLIPSHVYFDLTYHTIIGLLSALTDVKYAKNVMNNFFILLFDVNFDQMMTAGAKLHYQSLSGRNIDKYSSM